MYINRTKSLTITLLAVFSLVLVFTSCIDDSTPPVMPPVESLEMDFSHFQQEKSTEILLENWLYSLTTVSVFNIYASATLAIPTAAYRIALEKTPNYESNHQWLWSFDLPVFGATYTAKLTSTTQRKGKVLWEMRVDKQGPDGFTDFLWFEGEAYLDESVQWVIYDTPSSPVEVLKTNWIKAEGSNSGSLSYTLVDANHDYYKSTIESGTMPNETYDRYFNIYRSDLQSNVSIKWSTTDNSGRVKSFKYFDDEAWHCWNKYLLDDTCY